MLAGVAWLNHTLGLCAMTTIFDTEGMRFQDARLKGVSRRLLRKERPDIQKRYWKGVLLVAVLFRVLLWQRADLHRAAIHRAAAGPTLKPKDGYAVRAILPRPEQRGLPRTGS